jgi:ADP-ribose pyrophosphatase YjhB (NUDIX family)
LTKLAQYSPASLRIDPRKIIMKLQENKPVCGALVFNKDDSKILTIRVRNKFGFPKGKWNQHETARECAAREVQE